MNELNARVKKMKYEYVESVKPLKDKIKKKEEQIERSKQILNNHQTQLGDKHNAYKNEVDRLIVELLIDYDIDNDKAKQFYNYLLDGKPVKEQVESDNATSNSATSNADDVVEEYPHRY